MDFNHIFLQTFTPILIAYWWLIPVLIVVGFLRTPYMKGGIGEFQVNLAANLLLDKQSYTLFKNVTLPTEDGTTQIDHIIVSRYGVFVIETKNMQGWIFGSAQQAMWTQQIYKHKNQFQNPLRQNYKHTQTLQTAIGIDQSKIFPLVVFIGDSEFKTTMPDNVVFAGGYIRYIKSKSNVVLGELEVRGICEKIRSGRLKPSIKTHFDHVEHVRQKHPRPRDHSKSSFPVFGTVMVLTVFGLGILWSLSTLKIKPVLTLPQPYASQPNYTAPVNTVSNTFIANNLSTGIPQRVQLPADDDDPRTNPSQWDFISSKDKKCWFHKQTRRKVCEPFQ